ncbi:diaminopimelate decarboxylase [Clostridium thermarum]|uniref:diaminopimelate decarboxylase n=1 Tax=Clostridium thermarum TaxID=1716543 RepID=UPI0013D5E518|nr:diaminopimelate decarboxylase [Clostridium thermarum]
MRLFGSMNIIDNELTVGGVKCTDMVKEFGTPLYVYDEELLRDNCRRYIKAFKVNENKNRVAYAGKAFLTLAMCNIIKEEGLCLDVVSGGELYTAYKSGFPMERVYFHGNNKTVEEIEMGVKLGVGRFVVDNFSEIEIISAVAGEHKVNQNILLRLTPGIEAHTHDYIKTGQVDSKFGFTLLNNNTLKAVKSAIAKKNVELVGIHCHIGSQIFETEPYKDATNIMLTLMQKIYDETGHMLSELDLGGGFGIYYKEGDKPYSIEEYCSTIIEAFEEKCKELTIVPPMLTIEPGRSIVGNAGITLYTVGAIKEIPEIRKYVAVDGGMTDNIRPALYRAQYECVIANKVKGGESEQVTISGKCCESGDILLTDITIPEVKSGDILAVLSTGAYGYSMASNYNKIPKAAVVMSSKGTTRLICRRETYEDVIKNEIM